MKKKKVLWKIILVVGFIPFIAVLTFGIYSAIFGFSGLCFCGEYYGFKAFVDSIIMYSAVFYPTYIIGIIFITLSIIKLKQS